ncbi:hypothetical protein [Reyranella sp.]|uniref:hypothetical protein n=1 Tax=Reyranella sp. TaxID=1929291 RepID=UPI003D150D6F
MATEKAIASARQQLREQVLTLLSSAFFDRPSKLAQAVHPILGALLDGLDDLDDGEVPLAFRPSKKAHKSVKPAEVARLRLRAVSYVSALKVRGMPLPEAIATVAVCFQLSEDAVTKWRRDALKSARTTDGRPGRQVDLASLVSIDKFYHRVGHGPSKEQIIAKARKDGERLKVLQPNYAKGSKK